MQESNTSSSLKNTFRKPAPDVTEKKSSKPVKSRTGKKKSAEKDKDPDAGKRNMSVLGVFILFFSLFLFASFISFITNWFSGTPDDIFSVITFKRILSDTTIEVHNIEGRLGAALSTLFIKQGFGIATVFPLLWIIILGIWFTFRHKLFPIGRGFVVSFILMMWTSVTLGFFFRNTDLNILGGVAGYEASFWLEGFMGNLGTALGLFFIFIAILILVFNMTPHKSKLANALAGEMPGQDDTSGGNQNITGENRDKYNTVEYAVKEEDEIQSPAATTLNDKYKPQNTQPVTDTLNQERNIDLDTSKTSIKEPVLKRVEFTVETPIRVVIPEREPVIVKPKSLEDSQPITGNFPHSTEMPFDPTLELSTFRLPTLSLLDNYGDGIINVNKDELETNKNRIVDTLGHYGIQIDKIKATIGPTVTLYEIIPAPGVRIAKIKNLEDDIALSLSALGIRIIAPIPGKGTIGIEVPNQKPEIVGMKSILGSEKFIHNQYDLPFGIGKTIQNETFVADLTRMPHILMAGATGQGKSVGLNAIITSLLYRRHPAELKFVMIDPKKVELTLFSKIERHYLAKLPDSEEAIITDTRKVVRTLNSLNIEMDNRYDLLKDAQVRNIKEYNAKFIARKLNPNEGHHFLPYIVLVMDEFADLMMTAGKEVEIPLTRLAQLARAIGIHLVIATQRPSVNIITGTIKANFPARIAFRVISKIDSRTILDTGGADQLIGRGDMLLSQGGDIIRLQCAFIDTAEVERVTEFIGSQRGYPDAYALPEFSDEENAEAVETDPGEKDELFEDAARLIVAAQQGSTSLLQRKLKLGYNRAGRIIDQLESAGIVGPFEGSKAREVKIATEFALEQFLKDLHLKENKFDDNFRIN